MSASTFLGPELTEEMGVESSPTTAELIEEEGGIIESVKRDAERRAEFVETGTIPEGSIADEFGIEERRLVIDVTGESDVEGQDVLKGAREAVPDVPGAGAIGGVIGLILLAVLAVYLLGQAAKGAGRGAVS